jgi:hypothetical protein
MGNRSEHFAAGRGKNKTNWGMQDAKLELVINPYEDPALDADRFGAMLDHPSFGIAHLADVVADTDVPVEAPVLEESGVSVFDPLSDEAKVGVMAHMMVVAGASSTSEAAQS